MATASVMLGYRYVLQLDADPHLMLPTVKIVIFSTSIPSNTILRGVATSVVYVLKSSVSRKCLTTYKTTLTCKIIILQYPEFAQP